MVVATSMVNGFQIEISEKVFGFWAHIHVQPYSIHSGLNSNPITTHEDFYQNGKDKFEFVDHIQVTALKEGIIKTDDDFEGVVLKGIGQDFKQGFFDEYLVEGQFLSFQKKENEIIISKSTANRLQLKLNDDIILTFIGDKVRMKKFIVQGIYNSGIEEFDKQYALVDISMIQKLNKWGEDSVGGYEIFIKPDEIFDSKAKSYFMALFGPVLPEKLYYRLSEDKLDKLATEVSFALPHNITTVTIKDVRPGIFDWLSSHTTTEVIVLLIMLLVSGFNMITALLILILERTNMIGMLKALGSNDKKIRQIFIWNGAFIILIGIVLGNILGLSLCYIQDVFKIIKLPEESYYINYAPAKISWTWIMFMNLFALVLCTIFLLLPVRLVSKLNPVNAIRFK